MGRRQRLPVLAESDSENRPLAECDDAGAVVRINDCLFRTRGANCSQFNFMDQSGNIFDYILGFEAKGATAGRYYLVLSSAWTGEHLGTEWGIVNMRCGIPA